MHTPLLLEFPHYGSSYTEKLPPTPSVVRLHLCPADRTVPARGETQAARAWAPRRQSCTSGRLYFRALEEESTGWGKWRYFWVLNGSQALASGVTLGRFLTSISLNFQIKDPSCSCHQQILWSWDQERTGSGSFGTRSLWVVRGKMSLSGQSRLNSEGRWGTWLLSLSPWHASNWKSVDLRKALQGWEKESWVPSILLQTVRTSPTTTINC